jgi:magnesium chelatase subunit D
MTSALNSTHTAPDAVAVPPRRITRFTYPFSAVQGQEDMKLALLLNAINPAVGGVVVRGQKGTAKSTAARALHAIMPQVSDGRDAPFVDFPLGATEDMVLGSIDFESAIRDGQVKFQPGILHRAHEGILYIDEVNLLDDHLVDSILDAAESGQNIVEREGQSHRHASRFVLVGTMNPEEGELRPQFLDRFGLAVSVEGDTDPNARVRLLKLRESFDINPESFLASYEDAETTLAEKIFTARVNLESVRISGHVLNFISEICQRNNVAGHRADIIMERASRAFAALEGRFEVTTDDVAKIAPMVLLHRMRSGTPDIPPPPPLPPPEMEQEPPETDQDDQQQDQPPPPPEGEDEQPEDEAGQGDDEANGSPEDQIPDDLDTSDSDEEPASPDQTPPNSPPPDDQAGDDIQAVGAAFKVKKITPNRLDKTLRTGSGRRSRTRSASKQGRYVKSTPRRGRNDLALDATIRAAAPHQVSRRASGGSSLALHIRETDIREKIREKRVGNFLLFVVDGSGSMGAQKRMVETKAAILSLLMDAYQKRDKVGMVVFRGHEAEIVLPPTGSVDRAAKLLTDLAVGGRTPLSKGLAMSAQVLSQALRQDPNAMPLVVIMTDGRANSGVGSAPPHEEALTAAARLRDRFPTANFVVVDTEVPGIVKLQLAQRLSNALGATYFKTDDLRAEDLIAISKDQVA